MSTAVLLQSLDVSLVVKGMTNVELQAVRRAIALLHSLTGEPPERLPVPAQGPIKLFVTEYLVADPAGDLSCQELWAFYNEVAGAGELPLVRKAVFLRQLPTLMEAVFGARKAHNVERDGRRVRGFYGVSLRLEASLPEPQV